MHQPHRRHRFIQWFPGISLSLVSLVALGQVWVRGQGTLADRSPAPFVDKTAESALDFVHVNGAAGELLLPEVIGAGGALFDYDNDGDLDLFAVQGAALSSGRGGAPTAHQPSRLYRNDLERAGILRFTDVTEKSGIVATGYGMGAATGDFDNDGRVDLYVTNLGSNQLFRNNGDSSFTDVTAKSGTDDPRWSTSATFFDYDRDGWLDLFVANYVNFRSDMKRGCFSAGSARDYCNPVVYDPVPDRLFHNNRDGTFTDVSAKSGIDRAPARGLGVLAVDANEDGWMDLYVANDGDANQLWLNERGTGAFKDDALLAGVAVNRLGQAQGSMGIDAADVDGDGDVELFVTNLDNEANTLYMNAGKGLFEDRTIEMGLFKLGFTGFGTRFLDYDNDGWLDLVVVNGAVRHLSSQVQRGDPYPLKQRNQLFRNDRGRRFVDATDNAGPAFAPLNVARGAATGDLDNDGDVDLVVFGNNGPARVLLNTTLVRLKPDATNEAAGRLKPDATNKSADQQHWLGLRVIDSRYRRDALQARVELVGRDGRVLARRVQTDGSYCAASDPRVHFGLGSNGSTQTIRVHWPGAPVEDFHGLAVDRYWVLERGKAAR